jgi:hypothetical protein
MPRTDRGQQIVVAASGAFYTLTGLALLFAPEWFFENIGHFPPFNRHFIGDIGAFLIPLGLGLLLAARAPRRHRLLIGVAALGSVIHLLNHLYDDALGNAWSLEHFLRETLPLALVAAALAWAATDAGSG